MTNFKVINETGASPFSFDFGWMEMSCKLNVTFFVYEEEKEK